MELSRINYVKQSLAKSHIFTEDPLIQFIILWIGLNALYSQKKWEVDGRNYGEPVVKKFFKGNKSTVYDVIARNRNKLLDLFRFIQTEEQHTNLYVYTRTRKDFLMRQPSSQERAVETFTEFLVKIRNNMFHAVKQWNEKAEALLLARVNPILEELLKDLINV